MRSARALHTLRFRGGGVAPLTVLSLALLVAIVALVVDGGGLLEERRHVQATADAAALAAAADLFANYAANQGSDSSGTAKSSALAIAAANGYSNDGINSVVTVNVSPQKYQGGPNAGKALPAGYVEVIVKSNVGRTFSNIFASGTIPVSGRAVARGQWTPLQSASLLLNVNAAPALAVGNRSSLTVSGGLQVNSNSALAVSLGGGSVSVTQLTLDPALQGLVGSILSFLLSMSGSSPTINYQPPVADPLRYLPYPDSVQLGLTVQGTNLSVSSGNVDLYPGVYSGGLSVSGKATVTLHCNGVSSPGIYYLQGGGLSVSGQATVQTAAGETGGVLIYNDWQSSGDAVQVTGQGTLSLIPPASGPYQGISIFQGRGTPTSSAPTVNIAGNGNLNVTGTIYAAYANVTVTGNGTASSGGVLGDTLNVNGNGSLNVNPGNARPVNSRVYGLVE